MCNSSSELHLTELTGVNSVNSVLTAVVHRMNGAEQIVNARLAATRALNNALDFAQTNFQNEMERNFIMKVFVRQPWQKIL